MGGGFSLCNRTQGNVHVSLAQVGPLYYKNNLLPGECVNWNNIGNVHGSVIVRNAMDDNRFDDWAVAVPILTISFAALTAVAGGACVAGALGNAVNLAAVGAAAAVKTSTVAICGFKMAVPVGASLTIFKVGSELVGRLGKEALKNYQKKGATFHGYYTNCKRWDIKGGDRLKGFQEVKLNGKTIELPIYEPSEFYLDNGHHYAC